MGGQFFSKLRGVVSRPLKNYNIEARAMKEISRDKPKPAPPHPVMEKVLKEIKNDPNLLRQESESAQTLENLKRVYVTSQGDNPVIRPKRLPTDRTSHDANTVELPEGVKLPPGKATLSQIVDILSKKQSDPSYGVENIVKEYKLNENDVRNILEHYSTLIVYTDKHKMFPRPTDEGDPTGNVKMGNPFKQLRDKIDKLKE